MGWKETCAVEERMRFVVAAQKQEESFAAICRRFGVSRRVGYKWLQRFEEGGACGLLDRLRAPWHHPQAMLQEIAAQSIRRKCEKVRASLPPIGDVLTTKHRCHPQCVPYTLQAVPLPSH